MTDNRENNNNRSPSDSASIYMEPNENILLNILNADDGAMTPPPVSPIREEPVDEPLERAPKRKLSLDEYKSKPRRRSRTPHREYEKSKGGGMTIPSVVAKPMMKFEGYNFHKFKRTIEHLYTACKLTEFLRPMRPPRERDYRYFEDYDHDMINFESRQAVALLLLKSHCDEERESMITDHDDPYEIMELFRRRYQNASQAHVDLLRDQFQSFRMDQSKSMTENINRLIKINRDLKECGAGRSEGDMKYALLKGLPDSWDTHRSIWSQSEMSFEILYDKVLQVEPAMKKKNIDNDNVLVVKNKFQQGGKKNVAKSCHNCGKTGHFEKQCNAPCGICKKNGHTKFQCWHNGKNKKVRSKNNSNESNDIGNKPNLKYVTPCPGERAEKMILMTDVVGERSASNPGSEIKWIIDSGCSQHITYDVSLFTEFEIFPYEDQPELSVANGEIIKASGIGKIILESLSGTEIEIEDVLLVEDLKFNLLSVSKLVQKGLTLKFQQNNCYIGNNLAATRSGNMYILSLKKMTKNHVMPVVNEKRDLPISVLWHRRLCHVGSHAIVRLKNVLSNEFPSNLDVKELKNIKCESCIFGKQKRESFPLSKRVVKHPLDLIVADLIGPITNPMGLNSEKYVLVITDAYSNYVVTYCQKLKSETLENFKMYTRMVENQVGEEMRSAKVKVLRTDGGGEFISNEFSEFLKRKGIKHEITTPYTPQQNGIAERKNRTLIEMVRTMLHNATLSYKFWPLAIEWATYVLNRMPASRIYDMKTTPHEIVTGLKPNLNEFRIFGCVAYAKIPDEKRTKLDAKSIKGYFVGIAETRKAWKIFNPQSNSVIYSRDVRFDERVMVDETGEEILKSRQSNLNLTETENLKNLKYDNTENVFEKLSLKRARENESSADEFLREFVTPWNTEVNIEKENKDLTDGNCSKIELNENSNENELNNNNVEKSMEEIPNGLDNEDSIEDNPNLSGSEIPASSEDKFYIEIDNTSRNMNYLRSNYEKIFIVHGEQIYVYAISENENESNGDPKSVKEAQMSNEWNEWQKAMQDEFKSLEKNQTYYVVDEVPEHTPIVDCKWVFKKKRNPDGSVARYKARLVARGFTQTKGIDYNATFAPVVKYNTLRLLLALAAYYDWEIQQMDFETAFLNGDLEEDIYMSQPEGFQIPGAEGKVVKLRKALYGLKQAPREWNKKLHSCLLKMNFVQNKADNAFYYKTTKQGQVFVAVYVDDLMITGSNVSEIKVTKESFSKFFKVKDLGEVKKIIGIEVTRNRSERTIHISQPAYVEKLLKKFNMSDCKECLTPEEHTKRLCKNGYECNPNSEKLENVPYAEAVGALIYLATCTRPDIAHAVRQLSQYMADPRRDHWNAMKRVLRYLKYCPEGGITYGKLQQRLKLVGFADANFATDIDSRKSVSGYVFLLNGGAITWLSKKQATVAKSTTEAEYVAMSQAASEAMWIRQFLKEIGFELSVTQLYGDNQGAIALTENPVYHFRTKHIDVSYHYVRELIATNEIKIDYIESKKMLADVLTKGLNPSQHSNCIKGIGYQSARGSVECDTDLASGRIAMIQENT